MSISVYAPPEIPADEWRRAEAVFGSALLEAAGDPRLEEIVQRARAACGTTMAAVTVVLGGHTHVLAAAGMAAGIYRRSTSFCAHAILRPLELFCVPDASRDPRFAENPAVIDDPHLRFYAGAPLVTWKGHGLGTLCVFDPRPRRRLETADAAMLLDLANAVVDIAS